MKKKIYYWGPFIEKVATTKAILNSASAINQYSNIYESYIINAVGEWEDIKKKKNKYLNFINFKNKFYKKLPRYSFLKSRLSYILIFIKCFTSLKKVLEKNRPEYLIVHLIVSLPLILFIFYKFRTRLCLRISGKPKLNFLRKLLWKIASKNIYKVFSPTQETMEILLKNKIFEKNVFVLNDPIIHLKQKTQILFKKKENNINFVPNNIIMVGRLTKQKNYDLVLETFKEIKNIFPDLYINIFGEGELRNKLENKTKLYGIDKQVLFHGYSKNIYYYIKKSRIFILSSLWEDPGFVLIEAAFNNTLILSSNCESGPKEFLGKNKSGILFENNSRNDFKEKLLYALTLDKKSIKEKIHAAKKKVRSYTYFSHFRNLENHLSS
jgi:glycosyltransferase involved in cell wall biosynthesis